LFHLELTNANSEY